MHCVTLGEVNHNGAKFSVHVEEEIISPLHSILLRKMDDFLLDAQPRKLEKLIT
jgi:hypothetical protein